MCPASSNTGLHLAAPDVSSSSVYSRLSLPGSQLPPGSCKLFLPRPQPCVMFHGHIVQDTPFMATHGSGIYICVHMCVCVACSSFCSATLLSALLPSMSHMSLPWLQSAISWKCRSCPSEIWQPPLIRVCFAEQNVNSSLDGLLDLFN